MQTPQNLPAYFHVELETNADGVPVADSLGISARFGKDHKHILRDIRELLSRSEKAQSNFGLSSRPAKNGKDEPCYIMNRDGFSFLVMGFTGKNADDWKWAYIDAFNRMEAALRNREPAKLPSVRELAQMVIDAEDRAEAAEALLVAEARRSIGLANRVTDLSNQNVGLSQEIHETRKGIIYAQGGMNLLSAVIATPDGLCLRDVANRLEQPQHEFNEWLFRKGGWIYRSRSKSRRWKPHAEAIAKGWLGDKEFIRPKDSSVVTLYTPDIGWVDPDKFYKFTDVEVTRTGLVRILQYDDHPNPDAPALRIKRGEYGVKLN